MHGIGDFCVSKRLSLLWKSVAFTFGPLPEGKRSAVAVVNDSPVGCQSCDRAARRRLSATADWGSVLTVEVHPLRPGCAGPPEGELPEGQERPPWGAPCGGGKRVSFIVVGIPVKIARRVKPDVAIRTPQCGHFGHSTFKTVRFWGTDCQKVNCPEGAKEATLGCGLAMTVSLANNRHRLGGAFVRIQV